MTAFARNRSASAATEFALVLPIMLMLWAGLTEYANAVDYWRKLTQLARTVADLTAQGDGNKVMTAASMTDIVASSTLVMRPFETANLRIVVSALSVNLTTLNLVPRVCSSYAYGPGAAVRALGAAADLTVPEGYRTTGVRYLLAEVRGAYTPIIGSSLVKIFNRGTGTGQIDLTVRMPWPARGGLRYGLNLYTEVVLPNGAACT